MSTKSKEVNFRYVTPIDLVDWVEREFENGISPHTKQRLAKYGIESRADLETFLISTEPHELIWMVHPVDVLSFVVGRISRQIGITRVENLRSLRVIRSSDLGRSELTLIPLNRFEDRVETGDLLKSKLVHVWKADLEEYYLSPHLRIAEMENLCLEIEHFRQTALSPEKTTRALDDLFLRLSKAYEQQIKSLMYFCRAVMVQLLGASEPAERIDDIVERSSKQTRQEDKQKSWTLYDIERYIREYIPNWMEKSNIQDLYKNKMKILTDQLAIGQGSVEYRRPEKGLRNYRNISIHEYLSEPHKAEYINKMFSFIKSLKEQRLVTGYIVFVSNSATGTRLTLRLDGTRQNVNLLYRDLSLYTPFRSQNALQKAIHRTRVMAFPLSPDDRRVFQPLVVKHGVFSKEGYCKDRSALCYEKFEVEYSYIDDTLPSDQAPIEGELSVEE